MQLLSFYRDLVKIRAIYNFLPLKLLDKDIDLEWTHLFTPAHQYCICLVDANGAFKSIDDVVEEINSNPNRTGYVSIVQNTSKSLWYKFLERL